MQHHRLHKDHFFTTTKFKHHHYTVSEKLYRLHKGEAVILNGEK